MNLLTARTEVRDRIGERTENFWSETFINSALNAGQLRFGREERWPFLYTSQKNIPVAAHTSTIELIDGVDFNRHFNLFLTKAGNTELFIPERVSPAEGLRLRNDYRTEGDPQFYFYSGVVTNTYPDATYEVAQIVTLIPTPSVAFTAEYYFFRDPVALNSDDDEFDLPEAYHEAPVAWATAMCWNKEFNGGEKAQEQYNIYNSVLSQAQNDYKNPGNDGVIIWGGAKPEPGSTYREWYRRHIPGRVGV